MSQPIGIGLAGFGTVGAGVYKNLAANGNLLSQRLGTRFEVIRTKLESFPAGLRSGVLMALLDVVGQTSKAPAYQVMGGPTHC